MTHRLRACGYGPERRHPLKGFTLIELLLGLSIFAMVSVGVYSIFASGMRLSERAGRQNEIYQEARMAMNLMARDLENMVPYNFSNSYKDKSAFAGDQKQIVFLSAADDGLKAVSYSLASPNSERVHKVLRGETYARNVSVTTNGEEKAAAAQYLIREESDFKDYLESGSAHGNAAEILSTSVKQGRLEFSYAYRENEEGQTVIWKDSWTSKEIPMGVRVDLTFLAPGTPEGTLSLSRRVLIPHGSLGEEE